MPGTSGGTGQPNHFQCVKCRKAKAWRGSRGGTKGRKWRVRLTGNVKPGRVRGHGAGRTDHLSREYACEDCGHVGWSQHVDLKRKGELE